MSVRLSVFAEQLAILAEELRVGSLEHPSKLAGIFLADLDLVALGVNLEKELLAAERLELWRDFPSGRQTGNKATQSDNEQDGRYEIAEHLIHGMSVQKAEDARALFWRIEKIIRRVRHAGFLASVGRVAPRSRRFAALGVQALNLGHTREYAVALVAHHLDQQPRYAIRIGRRNSGNGLALHAAAVAGFPRRSDGMLAKRLAILLEELCVGSLQCPGEFRGTFLADVHLVALRVDLEKKLFAGGRLKLRRDFLRVASRSEKEDGGRKQGEAGESSK